MRAAPRNGTAVVVVGLVAVAFTLTSCGPPGSFDSSFSGDGKQTTTFAEGASGASDVLAQPDSKIIAVGGAGLGSPGVKVALARYDADGTPDSTFGTGGKTTQSISGGLAPAAALQADGKIVVAGAVASGSERNFLVARFLVDGRLDKTFGFLGANVADFGHDDIAGGVAIQTDGRIVLAGYSQSSQGVQFAVARFTSTGLLDSSYGSGGKVTTFNMSDSAAATAIELQSDGKAVAAGISSHGVTLARYNTDGSLDITFNHFGVVFDTGRFFPNTYSVALQPDGKILVGGSGYVTGTGFFFARYNSDGSRDTRFGTNGAAGRRITTQDAIFDIGVQSDGKIVGTTEPFFGGSSSVVRLTASGQPDTSFGSDGQGGTEITAATCGALELQSDNKALLGCTSANSMMVARLNA